MVSLQDNTIHMAFTALCIAKKTVLMNWKNKNNLNINQYRDYLWDYISLETASADIRSISLGSFDQLHHLVWVGVPILSGCGFFVGVGWQYGPGASGGSLGVGFLGGSALGLRPWPGWGIGDSWMLFSGAACGAAGDACAGGRRLPAWRPHCSGLVRGGFGDLGALCLRVGVTAGPGGLGSWLVCRREHGLVHALGPGSGVGVFDASVPPQGGGPIEGGKRALPGCLIVFVVGTDWWWWGGVVFPLLWGLVGRPGLPWALVGWAWAPRPGQIWGTGVPMGVSGGAGSKGGVFCPLWCFPPHP